MYLLPPSCVKSIFDLHNNDTSSPSNVTYANVNDSTPITMIMTAANQTAANVTEPVWTDPVTEFWE